MERCNIHIQQGGLFSTIQDPGRTGSLDSGIPHSGSLDQSSMALANWLCFQEMDHPVIEMTQSGISFTVDHNLAIGVSGGKVAIKVNGQPVDQYHTIHLKKNDQIAIGRISTGARVYLAFNGSILQELFLGSISTYTRAGIGGNQGKPLKQGDVISLSISNTIQQTRELPEYWRSNWNQDIIRICPGPEWTLLTNEAKKQFLGAQYSISGDSDRMGIRLMGPKVSLQHEIISCPVTTGTIQLPNSGQPIIVMHDGQSTGGYPRIAFVTQIDLKILAQKIRGDIIRFRLIDTEESHQLLMHAHKRLNHLFSEIESE